MKKYLIYIIVLLLASSSFSACETETFDNTDDETKEFNLCLSVGLGNPSISAALSKAVENENDTYNENYLDEVSCFFYPIGKEKENAVFVIENYSLKKTIEGTIKSNISNDQLNALFPTGTTTCHVYVVANHQFNFSSLPSTKLDDIKNYVITSDFKGTENGSVHNDADRIQTKFVMDGESTEVKVKDEGTTGSKKVYAHQSVQLYRSAAKITLAVKVKGEITDDFGVQWRSKPDEMRLAFRHGMSKSHINTPYYAGQSSDYFDTPGFSKFTLKGDTYLIDVPYYSYSSKWDTSQKDESYFLLVLPWAKVKKDVNGNETVEQYKSCYYQIPINPDGKKLDRNTYYKLNLTVGILGDFDYGGVPAQTLTPSYKILDWGINTIDIAMGDSEYLMAERNYVEMRDSSVFTMPYYTSDPLINDGGVTIDKITYESYRKNNTKTVTLTPTEQKSIEGDGNNYSNYSVTWDDDTNMFTFRINPEKVNSLAYYTIQHIDLTLTNESGLHDKVHVVWYPAIYIIGEWSQYDVWVNEQKFTTNNAGYESTEVFSDIPTNSKSYLGTVSKRSMITGTDGEINDNKNQYTVYISTLVRNSLFTIGDPRSKTKGKISGFSEDKGLDNYFHTDRDADMMVAPIFKMASSYGKTQPMNHANAEQRCASYQENGYPAGRWRLPTKGEIKFVVELSSKYMVIPSLFDGEYWSSKTNLYFSSYENQFKESNGKKYVRCVYDVWYWGDKKIKDLNVDHENGDHHWSKEYE